MKKLLSSTVSVGSLLLMAAPVLAATSGAEPGEAGTIKIPRAANVNINDLGTLIGAVLGLILIIASVLAFLYLILGGLQWITSGGDKAGLEAARDKITNAIVGLIVVAAAWAVMFLVSQFLGIQGLFSGSGLVIPRAF